MRSLTIAVAVLAVTLSTRAENAAYVLAYPWEDGAYTEFKTDAIFQERGDSKGTAFETRLNSYESSLRWRADNTTTDTLMAAFQYNVLEVDTNDPLLPDDQLINTSVVISTGKIIDERWKIGVQAGVGYAGDNEFGNGSATHALGLLSAVNTIDDDTQVIWMLNYDGNRNVWQDVPLPGVMYKKTVSDEFSYVLGVPVSGLTWTPDNHWTVSVVYKLLYNLDATVTYALDDSLTLFAQFLNSVQAYSVSGDSSHRRLFFTQRRLEGGLQWTPASGADITLAVGQAFDQEFERGWDNWDTDSVREISDETYLRAAIDLAF
ncbi:MAG: hypothetical protein ACYTGQ_15620 [Planctomycetota bacterium]|jgi:hypothetical protein